MGYKCSYCGNEDPDYIGFLNGKPYCRKCISFKDHEPVAHEDNIFSEYIELDLTYELTEKQRKISDLIIKSHDDGNNCFVHAVCGSGKTEIVFKVIEDFLLRGKMVGFATPRKDVVVELCQRLNSF